MLSEEPMNFLLFGALMKTWFVTKVRPMSEQWNSLLAYLLFVVAAGIAPFADAYAEDPCMFPTEAAKALTRSFENSVPPRSRPGVFKAVVVRGSDNLYDKYHGVKMVVQENAVQYRISYEIDGKKIVSVDLRKPKLESIDVRVEGDGKRLELTWDSGGSGCCTCDYLISANKQGFKLFAKDSGSRMPGRRWKAQRLSENPENAGDPGANEYLPNKVP
jgi:hypothetical protein